MEGKKIKILWLFSKGETNFNLPDSSGVKKNYDERLCEINFWVNTNALKFLFVLILFSIFGILLIIISFFF